MTQLLVRDESSESKSTLVKIVSVAALVFLGFGAFQLSASNKMNSASFGGSNARHLTALSEIPVFEPVTTVDVAEAMKQNLPPIKQKINKFLESQPADRDCAETVQAATEDINTEVFAVIKEAIIPLVEKKKQTVESNSEMLKQKRQELDVELKNDLEKIAKMKRELEAKYEQKLKKLEEAETKLTEQTVEINQQFVNLKPNGDVNKEYTEQLTGSTQLKEKEKKCKENEEARIKLEQERLKKINAQHELKEGEIVWYGCQKTISFKDAAEEQLAKCAEKHSDDPVIECQLEQRTLNDYTIYNKVCEAKIKKCTTCNVTNTCDEPRLFAKKGPDGVAYVECKSDITDGHYYKVKKFSKTTLVMHFDVTKGDKSFGAVKCTKEGSEEETKCPYEYIKL